MVICRKIKGYWSEMNLKRKEKNTPRIDDKIESYLSILHSSNSRSEILRNTAELANSDFGDYITPGSLNLTDEIHIIFLELLDQIVYEFRENNEYAANIRDYIIDDLYSRLTLILESLNSSQLYLKNLANRPLFNDDLVIIKKMKLAGAVPVLTAESMDITHLQIPVLKTLLCFTDFLGLDFFYNTFKNSSTGFSRAASLLGLKYCESKGLNWGTVRENCSGLAGLIDYTENFILSTPDSNFLPNSKEEFIFALLHSELVAAGLNSKKDINWILDLLYASRNFQFDSPCLAEINVSMGNVLLGMDVSLLRCALKDEKRLINTACVIDRLPNSVFNRLTGRLDELGTEFIFNLNSVIEKKRVPAGECSLNILSYLCRDSNESF